MATDQQGAPDRQHAGERAQDMSVRHSGPVRTVLHTAQCPVLAQDLLIRLDETYPQVPASAKEQLLTGLVRQGPAS
ncbi:lantibiotic dehydratase [Streptomyces violaceusniger]|uniref:lantibiotic dehydratase n=1 Tax=Streptomyces violaceusniger TaxID=68280 RepID=UPI0031D9C4BB